MLMPATAERPRTPAAETKVPAQAVSTPWIARFLPSLTDIAFLMPLMFLFIKLDGARTLLGDGDTGWHVRTGQWILANGRVPHTDMFSFSRPGAPWFAWEWLWDVVFGFLEQHWGMSAVVAASLLVICVTNALLFRLIRRACGNGLVAIAVTLLATGGCAVHWLARPHLFTLLFLAIALHITVRASEGRTKLLGWLVPLTLLWTNFHGGFFVVFLVLMCYIGGGLLNAVLEKDAVARRAFLTGLRPWLYTFAGCFAATFINPYGWELHHHVLDYISDPYQLNHITEFQSMNFHAPVAMYFEPLMILTVLVALWFARNRRFAELFLCLGWLHLALIAQRNLPLFAIAVSPLVACGICAALRAAAESSGVLAGWVGRASRWFEDGSADVDVTDRIGRVYLVSAVPVALVAAILLITPARPGITDSKIASTYNPKVFPEKALPVLLSPETHRVFAEDQWGDYLIYNLYPRLKVFIDGRSDFYGDDFGLRYLDLMNVQTGWQKILDKYSIDTIVIAPKFALTQTLKISRDWRVVYDDGVALVFRRNPRGPSSLVTSDEGKNRDRAITKTLTGDRGITQPTI